MIDRTCEHCGAHFRARPYAVRDGNAKFCSHKCHGATRRNLARVTRQPRKTFEERFWDRVDKRGPDECWPWLGYLTKTGYPRIKSEGRSSIATHTTLRLDGRERPSQKHIACHHCDNPPCVNPAHLFWGTYQDNANDMVRKGRGNRWNGRRRGENNPAAKITLQTVATIRSMRGQKTRKEIARSLGVSFWVVQGVLKGRTWKDAGAK